MSRWRSRSFVLLASAMLVGISGCATITQAYMRKGPAVFGGVRLDFNILVNDHTTGPSKIMAVLDLIGGATIAFDAAFLPVSIINELYEVIYNDGIDVEPPLHWDNPPPKFAPYSPPLRGNLPEGDTGPGEVEGQGV